MAERADVPFDATHLLQLARSPAPQDRERLLLTIADQCETLDCTTPEAQQALQDIFLTLVAAAEHRIRLQLAEKLASAPWAPHELITTLARDEIEIARPIIAQSPVLTNHDLVRLLVEATIEHQIEVARRPRLSQEVVNVVVDQGQPDVLAALAGNTTAELSSLALSRLVSFSERMAQVRAPLARHPMLTADLAGLLYGWVGESLRSALETRFQVDGLALDRAIKDSVRELHDGAGRADGPPRTAREDRAAMERRVVQKLKAAGQLRPGLLIRALHEGKLSLFATALSELGGFHMEAVQEALDSERPDELALACTAVGVDRSAFPTVLSLVRRLNGGRPGGESGADGLEPNEDATAPAPRRMRG